MSQKFQRKKEDFTCEHCGFLVIGNGYTNHCPKCLWGKHVDVHPGDRESKCCGMMQPESFTMKKQELIVIHRCVKCGFMRRNKLAPTDDMDILIALRQKPV
jgi:rubrerythrin